MREIKFRAKKGDHWVYFHLQCHDLKKAYIPDKFVLDGINDVDTSWQQYTGIKDTGGNDIYEGDIIEFEDYYMIHPMRRTKGIILCKVFWDQYYSGWRFEIINQKELKTELDLKPREHKEFIKYKIIGNEIDGINKEIMSKI